MSDWEEFRNSDFWNTLGTIGKDFAPHLVQNAVGVAENFGVPIEITKSIHDSYEPKSKNKVISMLADSASNVPIMLGTSLMMSPAVARIPNTPLDADIYGKAVTAPMAADALAANVVSFLEAKGKKENGGEEWTQDDTIKTLAELAGQGGLELYTGGNDVAKLIRTFVPDLRKLHPKATKGGIDYETADEEPDESLAYMESD